MSVSLGFPISGLGEPEI